MRRSEVSMLARFQRGRFARAAFAGQASLRRNRGRMVYLKAIAVGVLGGVIFGVVWLAAAMLWPILWQMWWQRGQGAGVGAATVESGSVLLAALIGFIVTVVWVIRRP